MSLSTPFPQTVSSGIPKNPGIPGLDFNPDPGIIENTIPGFFGILVQHRRQCLQRLLYVFRQLVGLFCTPRTFQSALNFCSTDPDRFFNEEQRKISAVDLLTNLIKEKTTSLILIGPYVFVQKAESNAYSQCDLKEKISAKIFIFLDPSLSTARGLSLQ